jgi:hypothetical protein
VRAHVSWQVSGSGGAKMGNVHLKWAFSEAAVLFLRHAPGAKQLLGAIEKKHGKGKALSILAHRSDGRCTTCCRAAPSSRWRSSARRSGAGSGRARRLTRASRTELVAIALHVYV